MHAHAPHTHTHTRTHTHTHAHTQTHYTHTQTHTHTLHTYHLEVVLCVFSVAQESGSAAQCASTLPITSLKSIHQKRYSLSFDGAHTLAVTCLSPDLWAGEEVVEEG